MNQDTFCNGVHLIGGSERAAPLLGISQRLVQRMMRGTDMIGDNIAQRLVLAVALRRQDCDNFVQLHGAPADAPQL